MLERRSRSRPIDGECYCTGKTEKVRISDLSCDGCAVQDLPVGSQPEDFIRLRIADTVEVSGHIVSLDANRGTIRFHGEIHPFVVRRLQAGGMAR
jgi:hypothetical protein